MRKLNLQDCGLPSEHIVTLLKWLETSANIEQLYLGDNQIKGDAIDAAYSLLIAVKTLTHFDIGAKSLTDGEVARLSEALVINKTLTYLDLSCSSCQDKGSKSLCDALKYNQKLKELRLMDTMITRTNYFQDLFQTNKTLMRLVLSSQILNASKVFDLQQEVPERSILYESCRFVWGTDGIDFHSRQRTP